MRGLMSIMKGCTEPNVYTEVPDGGWGWVVAAAFFFVEVFTYGIIKIFGIFLQDLMHDFGETNSRVSWIISICVFVMTFTAPLSTVMSNRFGYRPVVMIGGFLISLGTICTAFTGSINEMFITTGIVSGLGYCLTFLPTVTILSQYFSKRRSLVTSVASTGECFSLFALAPALTALKDWIGWRYCMVVIGVLQALVIACGALLRPIIIQPKSSKEEGTDSPLRQPETSYDQENEFTRTSFSSVDSGVQSLSSSRMNLADNQGTSKDGSAEKTGLKEEGERGGVEGEQEQDILPSTPLKQAQQKEEQEEQPVVRRPKLLDFSVLRDGAFVCYALFGLCATLAFFAPQLYVIELSVSRGVDRDHAAYMLSTMAVAEILGRLSIGCLLNRKPIRKIYILLICTVLLCMVLVFFTCVTEFWGLAVCCCLCGFLTGMVASAHIPMLAEEDVVGIERMPSAVGVYVFIQSFAGLAGPPLGGVLVDVTQNYGSAFYSCAAGMGLAAVFLGLVRPARTGFCCQKVSSSQEKDCEKETESTSQNHDNHPVDFLEVDLALESSPAKSQCDLSPV